MPDFPLKPSHKPVKAYFAALAQFRKHGHTTEGNTRSAFADLLKKCASPYGWHLVEEFQFRGTGKQHLRADGALIDELTLQHGIWEAKDDGDDLESEVKKKRAAGYPIVNTLFQSPSHAILYQRGRIEFDEPITTPEKLVEVLEQFFSFEHEHERDWEEAVTKFSEKIPDLAQAMTDTLAKESETNANFRERFASFADLARQSINPDLSDEAVNKMLVQHLLTERIFRKVFNNPEFTRRNVIAAEIEKVIDSITARHFSRDAFLKPLDRFYAAIEKAAEQQEGYTEKQHFLNAVYEKFFQSFDKKQADTHGIVYTPQPIVDFMVRSVEEILQQEFGKSLSDSGVHILDPFTGTGNFITRIMQQIKRSALPHKYAHELHCNEVMLLPYYIASMNIEHAYLERAGEYRPFEGICLVDTFELAEAQQRTLFSEENSLRVKRQKDLSIRVILGNPPYRVGQKHEDEDKKNRLYPVLDKRISSTYVRSSLASSNSKLRDPFVRSLRWATDRIGTEGVIAFVVNSGFLDRADSDGVRKYLFEEFTSVSVIDLGGNTRKHPHLSGTTHNVFGIKLGVAILLLVKGSSKRQTTIRFGQLGESWKRSQRLAFLDEKGTMSSVAEQLITPDGRHNWIQLDDGGDFAKYLPLGHKAKQARQEPPDATAIFKKFSLGLNSNRDPFVLNYSAQIVESNIGTTIRTFNDVQSSLAPATRKLADLTSLPTKESEISWSEGLKLVLLRRQALSYEPDSIRTALFRPYTKQYLYFNKDLNERRYNQPLAFPTEKAKNRAIVIKTGKEVPLFAYAADVIPVGLTQGGCQSFPFFTYNKQGGGRHENISSIALQKFRNYYLDQSISKWDIFHATYAVLHHPEYRTRYAANLKRELPRIPFPPDFQTFAAAGKRLMELHIDYEQQPEYPLQHIESEDKNVEVSFRVTRMKLSKDQTELRYNDFLLLRGIPPAVFDYHLGNRSALEWIIDQYRVTTDPRSGITNDPNREDDPKYILRLIGQVITVSLETNQIIASLPSLDLPTS